MYDSAMTKHKNELNPDHPEVAERVSEPWKVLGENGLSKRCTVLEVRYRYWAFTAERPAWMLWWL